MQEIRVLSLGQEDPLEKEMATHSSILAWEIPWTEEPGGLQSMGSQRVGHDFTFTFQYSCLGNTMDKGTWLGYSPGSHKSQTQLSTKPPPQMHLAKLRHLIHRICEVINT